MRHFSGTFHEFHHGLDASIVIARPCVCALSWSREWSRIREGEAHFAGLQSFTGFSTFSSAGCFRWGSGGAILMSRWLEAPLGVATSMSRRGSPSALGVGEASLAIVTSSRLRLTSTALAGFPPAITWVSWTLKFLAWFNPG